MSEFAFNVEYAVQMKCDTCKGKILNELLTLKSVRVVDINVPEQRLVVELSEKSPSAFEIQDRIEKKLGFNTIIRGTGNFFTAVSEIRGSRRFPGVFGVARFIQNERNQCLVDAVIDGLDTAHAYSIGFHQYGDLSDEDGFKTIGNEDFSIANNLHITSPKLSVKTKVNNCDLMSFIGRAFAVRTSQDIVGAAIVARASKTMDNSKKVCACSGKTLWQEREDNH